MKEMQVTYFFKCSAQYIKLLVANVVSRFGDAIDAIAFTWLVYALTESAACSAFIFALNRLPTILLQPFAGVWVERWNKKRIMVITDVVRAAIIIVLIMLYVLDIANPIILAVFTMAVSSAEAFCLPATIAIIPHLIEREQYAKATSLNASFTTLSQLLGMGVAGIVIGVGGVELALLVDALTFVCSALMIGNIRYVEVAKKEQKEVVSKHTFWQEFGEGIQYVRHKKIVWNFCLLAMIANVLLVPLDSLQSPIVAQIYGQGSAFLSYFGVMSMLGMCVGSLFVPILMKHLHVRTIIVCSGVVLGCSYFAMSLGQRTADSVVEAYILCGAVNILLSIAIMICNGVINIQFMKNVDETYLARAGAFSNALGMIAIPIASACIGVFTYYVSVACLLRCFSIFCIILFVGIGIVRGKFE